MNLIFRTFIIVYYSMWHISRVKTSSLTAFEQNQYYLLTNINQVVSSVYDTLLRFRKPNHFFVTRLQNYLFAIKCLLTTEKGRPVYFSELDFILVFNPLKLWTN